MISLKSIPWKSITKQIGYFCSKHSTKILTGLSCVGTVATAVVTAKNAPKAMVLLEQAQMDKGDEPLTWQEKVKATWKCYIPTAVCVGTSVACGIASNVKSLKTEAALLSAYTLSQDAAKVYQDKVVETVGERKERDIRDKAAQERIKDPDYIERCHAVIQTGNGDDLMYDASSDRYFRSSREALERAQVEIQKEIDRDGYMSLNEVYYKMGLPNTDIGYLIGFNKWVNNCDFEFTYGADLPSVGPAAIAVQFTAKPHEHFNKVY